MAITEPFELDGVTIGVTEWAVAQNEAFTINSTSLNTDDGVYQLWVDLGDMIKADEIAIRAYEKVEATGGAQKRFAEWIALGVQSEVFVTPTFILMHGWEFTLQRIAGTDIVVDASIRKVA